MRFASILVVCTAASLGAQTPGLPGTSFVMTDTTACPAPAPATSRDSARFRPGDSTRTVRAPSRPDARGAAIVLRASASAREVRFASPPHIRVRLCGAVTDSVRVVERRNLPDPVRPGTTYKDVYVAVEILGHLNARCIEARMGVAPRDSATTNDCASVSVRDSVGAARLTPRPPR